jgi:hypothetical protein
MGIADGDRTFVDEHCLDVVDVGTDRVKVRDRGVPAGLVGARVPGKKVAAFGRKTCARRVARWVAETVAAARRVVRNVIGQARLVGDARALDDPQRVEVPPTTTTASRSSVQELL